MRNIIITGGELFNKGAQAMTFVAVDELKKRFPDHEIYLLSEMDRRRPEAEKAQYAFYFTGWYPVKYARAQRNPALRLACLLRNREELLECEALYRNCDLMVDISGYGLGSNWGINQLTSYLDHLEFAKCFGIPCYLMPQSFGPFDFQGEKKAQGDRIPELLSSVKVICAREQEGYDLLKKNYHLQNLVLRADLVLTNPDIDPGNVFSTPPVLDVPEFVEHSVGIIPNEKSAEIMDQKAFLSLYQSIVSRLLRKGKTVYLLTHATADRDLCQMIKNLFSSEDKVIWYDRDFNCLEYNKMVGNFEFLVASRFHSIVHGLKNFIPCIALGWAVKYSVLLDAFGQSQYCFDLSQKPDEESICRAVDCMCEHFAEESCQIRETLLKMQDQNVFDLIKL